MTFIALHIHQYIFILLSFSICKEHLLPHHPLPALPPASSIFFLTKAILESVKVYQKADKDYKVESIIVTPFPYCYVIAIYSKSITIIKINFKGYNRVVFATKHKPLMQNLLVVVLRYVLEYRLYSF